MIATDLLLAAAADDDDVTYGCHGDWQH